jgi:group II intron reverse transcriptase/maturase
MAIKKKDMDVEEKTDVTNKESQEKIENMKKEVDKVPFINSDIYKRIMEEKEKSLLQKKQRKEEVEQLANKMLMKKESVKEKERKEMVEGGSRFSNVMKKTIIEVEDSMPIFKAGYGRDAKLEKDKVVEKIRNAINNLKTTDLVLPKSFIKSKELELEIIKNSNYISGEIDKPIYFDISKKKARELAKNVFNKYFTTKTVIENIRKRSEKDKMAKFRDLFSLLYREDNIIAAITRLKDNKGSTTEGVDKRTVDAMSKTDINNLMDSLKDRSFRFKPVKKIMIPKPGKKELRPLGIPTWTDKIVQEMVRDILNAIYEPIFKDVHKNCNFGFRPKLGTLHAMEKMLTQTQGMEWVIEGDIKAAFPSVNHSILMSILGEKIEDKEFLGLINNGLRSGAIHEGTYEHTLLGTPQGGIASPILFNIYMAKFDEFILNDIEKKVEDINKREKRREVAPMPVYFRIKRAEDKIKERIRVIIKELGVNPFKNITFSKEKELAQLNKLRKRIVMKKLKTPIKIKKKCNIRIYYTRYADDFVFLTNGSKQFAIEIKQDMEIFLKERLELTLSPEKTKITNAIKETFQFLGFSIGFHGIHRKLTKITKTRKLTLDITDRTKKILVKNQKMKSRNHLKRTTGTRLLTNIDRKRLENRLIYKQFIDEKAKKGIRKKPWTLLELPIIIERYNAMIRGLVLYYAPINRDFSTLCKYIYLLNYSCYHTLANKYNCSLGKIIKKFGKPVSIEVTDYEKAEKERKTKEMPGIQKKKKRKKFIPEMKYKIKEDIKGKIEKKKIIKLLDYKGARLDYLKIKEKQEARDEDFLVSKINWRTAYKINKYCVICGTESNVEIHHIKHVKKGKATGWVKTASNLNRKTLMTCKNCHRKIHRGEYNGIGLDDLYDIDAILF